MSESLAVSVWMFTDDVGAQRAVYPLALTTGTRVRLADACVVSWPATQPRPVAWQERDLSGDRRFSGAFWGLIISSLFLLPLTVAPTAATSATPAASDKATRDGLSSPPADSAVLSSATELVDLLLGADFSTSVQRAVVPGSSALIVFDASQDTDALTRTMPGAAHRAVHQTLDVEHQMRLHAAFDDEQRPR